MTFPGLPRRYTAMFWTLVALCALPVPWAMSEPPKTTLTMGLILAWGSIVIAMGAVLLVRAPLARQANDVGTH